MAKQAKIKQTDYTKGGRDISNTAIPLYQENLTRMGSYLENPQESMDSYLNKYFSGTAEQSDFLRNYQKAMAGQTGSNYAAISGGYSSLGQSNYADQQRYWNDLANRLYSGNVTNAYSMANQDFANMLNANKSYNQAYELGELYSNIDQYNDLIDQSRNNWIGNVMNTAGDIGLSSGNPWGMAIGGALKVGSNFVGKDTDGAMSIVGTRLAGKPYSVQSEQGSFLNQADTANMTSALQDLFNKFKNRNSSSNGAASSWSSGTNLQGVGNYGLNTNQQTSGYKFSWQK